MKHLFILLILFLLTAPLQAQPTQTKEVAITIDDLPFVDTAYFSIKQQKMMFRNILQVLKKYHVPTVGFIISSHIEPYHAELLDEFIADGHQLGNHADADINQLSSDEFQANILIVEEKIKPWRTDDKYFRYPLLRRGETKEKKDAVANFLQQNNYAIAPVTMNSDDWRYSNAYTVALQNGDTKQAKQIGESYVAHAKEQTYAAETQAIQDIGRPIKQILLLHMNELNSDYLEELLVWYNEQGWTFITLKEALQDPVYQLPDHYTGREGLNWLDRIAVQ